MATTEKKIKENVTTEFKSGLTLTRRYDTTIPVLEIRYKDTVGYLSPFRAYRFQVSGTADGQCDMGSSRVTRLTELRTDELLDLARLALYSWARTTYHGDIREVIFSSDLQGLTYGSPLIDWINDEVHEFLINYHTSAENRWKYPPLPPEEKAKENWNKISQFNRQKHS